MTNGYQSTTDPPQTIKDYACDVRDLLGLHDWTIVVKVADVVGDDANMGGDCAMQEPYRIATITLRRDEDLDALREHVMHEMLHIALAPYSTASGYVKDMLSYKRQSLAEQMLVDAEERVVTPLAKALVHGIRPPASDQGCTGQPCDGDCVARNAITERYWPDQVTLDGFIDAITTSIPKFCENMRNLSRNHNPLYPEQWLSLFARWAELHHETLAKGHTDA